MSLVQEMPKAFLLINELQKIPKKLSKLFFYIKNLSNLQQSSQFFNGKIFKGCVLGRDCTRAASDPSEGQNRAILIGDNSFQWKLAKNYGLKKWNRSDKNYIKVYKNMWKCVKMWNFVSKIMTKHANLWQICTKLHRNCQILT